MAKKMARQIFVFECTVCKNKNYTSSKNVNNIKEKIELNKYCPNCKKHTLHKEVKK